MTNEASSVTLYDFTDCHAVISDKLSVISNLAQPRQVDAAASPKQAAEVLEFFENVVRRHHQDEEGLLFVTVVANAIAGAERDAIYADVKRLTAEHREIEALIDEVTPGLVTLRDDHRDALLDQAKLQALTARYKAHAAYEEASFLPQAQAILDRAGPELSRMGLQLHLRKPAVRQQMHFSRWT
jgi:hemerythrin-like domain-containing protein